MATPWLLRLLGPALRQVPELVREAYAAQPVDDLLDVPCGAIGSLVHGTRVERVGRVVGVDLSIRMLARGRMRVRRLQPRFAVELQHADATELPYRDASFGAALSINGLHCMPDPAAVLHELARVVRPGGMLTVTTLVATGTPRSRRLNRWFERLGVLPKEPPTPQQLQAMLAAAGWVDVEHRGGRDLVALVARRG
jgi:ubiquinone/menaquinone biosynthesis C-methylase UbiE